ncbi:MAG TPA: Flp pilus assembly protein CpaB [Candidatus Limnocylindria bacterium]|nr:Flp pilus assembly protein CpaB [Candidatus Limnocylindria bacterium]
MIARRWLLALAIGAGCVAGAVFFAVTARGEVVVASRDIDVPRPLAADDLEVRAVASDLVPADAAHRVEDVIGLVPRAPLLRGQIVQERAVAAELAELRAGVALAPGLRAVAIPVTAVNAVGGAVAPGSRVDVLAVPVLGRAPAGRAAELLVTSATVLDVRGESGSAFVVSRETRPGTFSTDRIASVVIAIGAADEVRFADRIATSTFVLALVSAR